MLERGSHQIALAGHLNASTNLELPDDAPNREERLLFARMPFHVVKIGNTTKRSSPSLTVDNAVTHASFSYKSLLSRFSRPIAKHPIEPERVQGLLFICKLKFSDVPPSPDDYLFISQSPGPNNGGQLIGPINDNSEVHPCFSDFIISQLAKTQYLLNFGLSEKQNLRLWKNEYPYCCRDTCPGDQPMVSTFNDSDSDPLSSPVSSPAPGPSRRSLQIPTQIPSQSPTARPPFLNLDSASLPSVSLIHSHFVPPSRPDHSQDAAAYVSPSHIQFLTFHQFEEHVLANCGLADGGGFGESFFHVSGLSITEAANALILFIKGANCSHTTPLEYTDSVKAQIDGLSLSKLFLFHHWVFNA
jgi:hypothetical protein